MVSSFLRVNCDKRKERKRKKKKIQGLVLVILVDHAVFADLFSDDGSRRSIDPPEPSVDTTFNHQQLSRIGAI